eukprot:146080-Prorocentrum_minimum.AAC.2
MFDEVDSSDDRRVDKSEFKAALDKIASWGVTVEGVPMLTATLTFQSGDMQTHHTCTLWASALPLTHSAVSTRRCRCYVRGN